MAQLLIILVALSQLLGLGSWGPILRLAQQATTAPITHERYVIAPLPIGTAPELNLTATSALVIDRSTGQTLYAKDPTKQLPIASITKLFTILVILRDHSLDEVVTVPPLPTYQPGAVLLAAPTGSKFTVEDLVKAALIPSDNDAADILAIHDAGTPAAFTAKMNQLMADWGIEDLHFTNTNGLIDSGNYATAQSLSQAGRLLLTSQTAKALVQTQAATIKDQSGRTYSLATTNELLKEPGFYGIKTGYTPQAGQCLVALAQVHGHDIISVLLGSQDRFGETKRLVDATSQGYTWH